MRIPGIWKTRWFDDALWPDTGARRVVVYANAVVVFAVCEGDEVNALASHPITAAHPVERLLALAADRYPRIDRAAPARHIAAHWPDP